MRRGGLEHMTALAGISGLDEESRAVVPEADGRG